MSRIQGCLFSEVLGFIVKFEAESSVFILKVVLYLKSPHSVSLHKLSKMENANVVS